MGKDSKIEWTDHTFNPWWGCSKVSAGCANCYAEGVAKRLHSDNIWGVHANRRFFGEKHWAQPLKWNHKAKKEGKRFKVFCGSMCDVFEHLGSLVEAQDKLLTLIEQTPHLDWLLLTKRLENRVFIFPPEWLNDKLPDNIWMGVSIENQEQADIRTPMLLRTPARVRFLSVEPMLEGISLGLLDKFDASPEGNTSIWRGMGIDWVIVGGESGKNKRLFNPNWARSIRDQCEEANVPFFFKQVDKIRPIPNDLKIREFPNA